MRQQGTRPPKIFLGGLLILLCFWTSSVNAKWSDREARFFSQFGNYNFSVTTSNNSASVSGFGAYSFGVEYCFLDQFSAHASYNYLKASGVGGDSATGIDVAIKYYPVTYSGYKSYQNGPLEVSITSLWRPYVGFAFRQREFVLVLTTNYVGYGLFAGVDYQLLKNWFLNFEYRMDSYFGGDEDTTASMSNILLGFGYQF